MRLRSTASAAIFVGASGAIYAGGNTLSALIFLSVFTLAYAVEADLAKAKLPLLDPPA